ncbi:response regulator transcription factor [Anaerococcus marasmi]|uniref:response regulator transcription factor n=1 Tax=Anaerococcus marasmi TaxID=2057797 RepID=UPI000CF92A0A|nr:response regulator transcription factor [Anaerococcus marasmi]
MKSILFLEDEIDIREVLSEYLKIADFSVTVTDDGNEAIEILNEKKFDVAILDIMVNGKSGLEVLEFIRKNKKIKNTNVVMLTALEDINTQIEAFDLYCDDYIIKPVQPILLIKKIEMILQRRGNNYNLSQDGLVLDNDGFRLLYDGKDLKLTVTEFQLMKLFIENKKKVFSRENLITSLYDTTFYGSTRTIDSHIKNLRKKLPKEYIKTLVGVGYKFNEEA